MYQPLVAAGQTQKALQLTAQNRATIEAAYHRPVAIPVYTPTTASATTPTVAADTTTAKPVGPVKAAVQNLTAKIRAAVSAAKANRTASNAASHAGTPRATAAK